MCAVVNALLDKLNSSNSLTQLVCVCALFIVVAFGGYFCLLLFALVNVVFSSLVFCSLLRK